MQFYDRQFITRNDANKNMLVRFENILNEYFISGKAKTIALPSAAYCADQLYLSSNYFGDLIKKETGNTALDYIHSKLIDEAKGNILK